MTSSTTATTGHLLLIPFPAQGHLIPLLDLAHHLLIRGLTVTILVTPGNLPLIQPLLSSHPPNAVAALVLPFPPHPSLPAGVEHLKDLPPNLTLTFIASFRRLRRPLLRWISSHPTPPSAILSDMFLGWTNQLASRIGIKRLIFWTSSAFSLSVFTHLWQHLPPAADEDAIVSIVSVPNQPQFQWRQLSLMYRLYASGRPGSEFLREEFLENLGSWGFVVNSLTSLEQLYLTHMKATLGHDRVWAVGPLFSTENEDIYGPRGRGGSSPINEEVLSWLDKWRENEVVYIAFGSQSVLTNEHMEVLAHGLEKSGVPFVWKINEPCEGHVAGDRFAKLPPGFEDRVADRGVLIRGWAPQVSILRHKAVGSFLTHCGWNSMLEGLIAGVTMLAWPLATDQFSNAKLVVDELNVGLMVGDGSRFLPNPDELARAMSMGTKQRSRVPKDVATSEGGVELDCLVQCLSMLPKPVS